MPATTIRQAICDRIRDLESEAGKLWVVLGDLPSELLSVEADSVRFWAGDHWFRMRDESHASLCADLMELGLEPTRRGRKKAVADGMKAEFTYRSGDEGCVFVDVVRPAEGCVRARVRVTDERVISVCGELPSNYEIVEILDEAA